jgi:hypothetical protein
VAGEVERVGGIGFDSMCGRIVRDFWLGISVDGYLELLRFDGGIALVVSLVFAP